MNKPPVVFMFSGQGSHYFRMGEELFQQQPVFRKKFLELNEIAQVLLGESVVEIVYGSKSQKMDIFDKTRHTHPAIFMTEIALAETLMSSGLMPDYVLGTSMGSFAAATVAGCCSAEQALSAVIKQADVLERFCEPGGMTAVLDSPSRYHSEASLHQYSELAAVNFDQHFVVAANTNGLMHIEEFLGQDVSWQRLAVSQAFHSALIDPAKENYLKYLSEQSIAPPKIPLICCTHGGELATLPDGYFWQVIREPIKFQQTIQLLEANGTYNYIDLGPAGTLATFLKYNFKSTSNSKVNAIMTPYGKECSRLESLI